MTDISPPKVGTTIVDQSGLPVKSFFDFIGSVFSRLPKKGTVTLTASTTSTVVTDSRVNTNSVIHFSPTTANAATAFGGLYTTVARGSFTITHPNTADLDKTFSYTVT